MGKRNRPMLSATVDPSLKAVIDTEADSAGVNRSQMVEALLEFGLRKILSGKYEIAWGGNGFILLATGPTVRDWQAIETIPVDEYVIVDCSPVPCICKRLTDGTWIGENEDEIVWDDPPKRWYPLPAVTA